MVEWRCSLQASYEVYVASQNMQNAMVNSAQQELRSDSYFSVCRPGWGEEWVSGYEKRQEVTLPQAVILCCLC